LSSFLKLNYLRGSFLKNRFNKLCQLLPQVKQASTPET